MSDEELAKIEHLVVEEIKSALDALHDFNHVERVRKNALKIVEVAELENQIDKNLLSAICLLHDLTFASRRYGFLNWLFERWLVKRDVNRALQELDIKGKEIDIILDAVFRHARLFAFLIKDKAETGLYARILRDADTLDFYSTIRIKTLMMEKNDFRIRRFMFSVGRPVFKFLRKNIAKILNFPQAAVIFDQQKL